MRQLTSDEISELANKPKVKKIAVENFLMTAIYNETKMHAEMNLSQDARLYKWNIETIRAIKDGLNQMFG